MKNKRRYLLFILILGLIITQITSCTTRWKATQVESTPVPIPLVTEEQVEHIILTWKDDPATSQAVTWRTNSNLSQAFAEIALADPSPNFRKNSQKYHAETIELQLNDRFVYYHTVNFVNLHPKTTYAYRVGSGEIWSEWFHFRTADAQFAPFSFIFFGDAQNKILSLWSRAIRSAYAYAPESRFMIHAGDLVNRANSDRQWDEWFTAGGWIFAMVPSLPVAGNHEYKKNPEGGHTLSKYWRPQFTLPENGVKDLTETVYYIDYQGVRIISLNSSKSIKEQARWLETVLEENPNNWTVIVFHHSIFPSVKGRKNPGIRKLWKPIFDKFKVDLILQGHDHNYARVRSCQNLKNVLRTDNCTVYVTSVSGGKMYQLDPELRMDRAGENMQLFQVISFTNDTMHYEAVTVTGEQYDSFRVIKREDASKLFIEEIPSDLPERMF
jgi:3',5'-cyclic AMP phosphodiesterase CpdA